MSLILWEDWNCNHARRHRKNDNMVLGQGNSSCLSPHRYCGNNMAIHGCGGGIMQPCDHCGFNVSVLYRIPNKPDRVCSDCRREYMAEYEVCQAEHFWDLMENR